MITENYLDGLFLSGSRWDNRRLMSQLPNMDVSLVDVDATAGAELAVTYSIERGHQRIGIITNAPSDDTSAQQRRDGYIKALEKANLPMPLSASLTTIRIPAFDLGGAGGIRLICLIQGEGLTGKKAFGIRSLSCADQVWTNYNTIGFCVL